MGDDKSKEVFLKILQQSFTWRQEFLGNPSQRADPPGLPYFIPSRSKQSTYKYPEKRLYLRDIFEASKNFNYDIVLTLSGIHTESMDWETAFSIHIGNEILVPRKIKEGENNWHTFEVVIPHTLINKGIESGYLSNKVNVNEPRITCNLSLQQGGNHLKNLASLVIFQGGETKYPVVCEKELALDHPVLAVMPNQSQERDDQGNLVMNDQRKPILRDQDFHLINIMPCHYPKSTRSPRLPYAYDLKDLRNSNTRFDWRAEHWLNKTDSTVLFKFFEMDSVGPQFKSVAENTFFNTYDCSFIQTCEDEDGTYYFKLKDPRSLSTEKNGEEWFFQLSNDRMNYRINEMGNVAPRKFHVLLPMDDRHILGIKMCQKTSQGESVDMITAIANTDGLKIAIEPSPVPWDLSSDVKWNAANNTYVKIDQNRGTVHTYYPNQNIMVHKQINDTFGQIPNEILVAKSTERYDVGLTPNYYCTIVEFQPRPGLSIKQNDMNEATVDVWDCIKDVVKDRIGWTEADSFVLIQYTTSEDVTNKSWDLDKKFNPNIVVADGRQLETGIVHKISHTQMWGTDDLSVPRGQDAKKHLGDQSTRDSLQIHFGQGTDVIVVGAVKDNTIDYHMIKVTGQLMSWWGRPYNY